MPRNSLRVIVRHVLGWWLASVALVGGVPVMGQEAGPLERARLIAAAREVMTSVDFCALVTLDEHGRPRVRTMQPFAPEADLTVWMGTRRGTRKLDELALDRRATLYYSDPQGPAYVTLLGEIEVIEAPSDRSAHWNPAWQEFYDDGPRGDDYVLLRFVPSQLELVSVSHGIAAEPKSWRPAIVELSAKAAEER